MLPTNGKKGNHSRFRSGTQPRDCLESPAQVWRLASGCIATRPVGP